MMASGTWGETWLDWERDGADWPMRSSSRFLTQGGTRWHVQVSGPDDAPALLMLHGTGAASHSFGNLVPLLATRFRLVVPDLPCHGFSRPTGNTDLSLPGMTRSVSGLLSALDIRPAAIIGHSAGAAIAVSLAATAKSGNPPAVIAVNGAFLPIRGDRLLSPIAKLLFANPFSASVFARLAGSTPLGGNLIASTGSAIDEPGRKLYRRLMTSSGHVRGALGMMAAWDLSGFARLLAGLEAPLTLVASRDDPMVPVRNSEEASRTARKARLVIAERGGHLLHECDAPRVARDIIAALEGAGIGEDRTKGVDAA